MRTQVSHDAFARESITREKVYTDRHTCSWCGQVKENKQGKYLFRYFVEPDSFGAQPQEIGGLFDSIECMRYYHS